MSKSSSRKVQASETYRITFHGAVASEQAFIQAWDAQPHGRRLAWARNNLNMGLIVHSHGELKVFDTEASSNATGVRTIDLSLSRHAPEELAIIQLFERLPMRRRTEKLRELLLAGRSLLQNLPLILSTLQNSAPNPVAVDEVPETVPATQTIDPPQRPERAPRPQRPKPQKQIEQNAPPSEGVEPELGENPQQAAAAEVEVVSVVQLLPATPVNSGIQAHELDIDLSLFENPVRQDGQAEVQPEESQPRKRPELMKLFS